MHCEKKKARGRDCSRVSTSNGGIIFRPDPSHTPIIPSENTFIHPYGPKSHTHTCHLCEGTNCILVVMANGSHGIDWRSRSQVQTFKRMSLDSRFQNITYHVKRDSWAKPGLTVTSPGSGVKPALLLIVPLCLHSSSSLPPPHHYHTPSCGFKK